MTKVAASLTAGLLAIGALLGAAPAAHAQPVPGPEPVPVPSPSPPAGSGSSSLCQNGEVMQYGNCVPAMTPLNSTTDESVPEGPLRVSDTHTSTTQSGLPTDLVPNINGTPCTGYWMSTACYAENMGDSGPAVIPRSTLSSSP